MDITEILLLVYGGILIVVGLFALIDSKNASDMFDEIIASKSIGRIWSTILIIFGLVTLGINYTLIWEGYLWVLPLLGWLTLIKGVFSYWWPSLWNGFKQTATSNIIVTGLIATIIGVLVLWLAFVGV